MLRIPTSLTHEDIAACLKFADDPGSTDETVLASAQLDR